MTKLANAQRILRLMDLRCKIAHDQRFQPTTRQRELFWDQRWWQALRGWRRAINLKMRMS